MNPRAWRGGIATCTVVFSLASGAFGAEPTLTPEKALSYVRAGDLHFSPDGATLAYVVNSYRWDWRPRIRVLDIASGKMRELTPAGKSERSPQWSPDGKFLAFLSNRDGKTQIFAIPAGGTRATALTMRKFSVDSFRWSPDGRAIACLAKDDDATEEGGPQIADRESDISRLWLVDPASKVTRKLGEKGYRIEEIQWQDLSHILAAATDEPRVEKLNDAIYRISTGNGAIELVSRPPQPFDNLLVSPDGRQVALRSTRAKGPIARDLFVGTIRGDDFRDVSVPPDLAVVEARWHEQPAIWVRVADGFANRIWRISSGAAPLRIDLPLSVDSFDVSRGGLIAFAGEDFGHLPAIYLRNSSGNVRLLADLQEGWDGVRLASTTIFRTASFDGTQIESALMRPPLAQGRGKSPLVVLVHGGPASNFSTGYGWDTGWAQLLAAHGYEVLMVNPRGSNGYGEDFLKANRGDWGGGDYRDIMTVLDTVIARGETDPDRLGIGGWSYGGEMTAWAIGHTGRFRAAVAGAGVFDQQAEFETEDGPAGDEWYFGTPWEHPEIFARNSPATFIRNAHTPTLILDGLDDASNPVGQSEGLYRALKHFGVETEMVLYPGEGHSPRSRTVNIDMFARILGWYDSHLK